VRLLGLVRDLATAGRTVLYTTHYMQEAENLCDRLAVIDHGKIIAMGTLGELRALLGEKDLLRLTGRFDPAAAAAALARLGGAELVQADAESLTLAMADAGKRLPAVFEALAGVGTEIRETTLTQPSLESLFIKLTGKELRE
jgi:ABC-2 type transport system ATP-binding protein